jgi:hypothetical protein
VTPSARLLSPLARLLFKPARIRSLTAIALVCAGSALASAAPAGAVVTTVEGTTVGLQPRNIAGVGEGSPATFKNSSGYPVMHSVHTIAIYWDPTDSYHGEEQALIDRFLAEAGAESHSLGTPFAVGAQYTDSSNAPASKGSVFLGAYTDTDPYPAATCVDPEPLVTAGAAITCLTDAQIKQELATFVAAHGLPTGMSMIFDVLTPQGVAVCLDAGGESGHCSDFEGTLEEVEEQEKLKSEAEEKEEAFVGSQTYESYARSFCSYHSDLNPGGLETGDGNTILYDVIPWTAGGFGNGRLKAQDRSSGSPCQDGVAQQEPNQLPSGETGPDGTFDHGLGDLIFNQIAVEHQNTVTNPLLNAWQDAKGHEGTDECRNHFSSAAGMTKVEGSAAPDEFTLAGTLANERFVATSRTYYLNNAFNLAGVLLSYPGVPCLNGVALEPAFTSPNPVNANEIVGFDGMESNISLNASKRFSEGVEVPNYAKYAWSFGDGTPVVTGYAPGAPACEAPWLSPCAASVFHSYQYGGTYTVTLTVTDVAGNAASTSQTLTVVGPAAPGSAGSGSSSPGSSSSSSTSGTGSPGAVSNPTISAIVRSKSLRTVLRHGLRVSYSVNEKVTGRFEVMMPRTLARRLGLKGRTASGLAPGSAKQTVVETAFLSTTRGGRATLTIPFPAKKVSRKVAARLSHLRSAPLTVRLSVRNAHAGAATALSSTSLH